MSCYLHPEAATAAYCRSCGRPLCAVCERLAEGSVFCPEHAPAAAHAGAYAAAGGPMPGVADPPLQSPVSGIPRPETSPGLAFVLGLIPGVGAIYNGQYLKGLLHALMFGLLISLANSTGGTAGQPLLTIMAIAFFCYMPFEAYHTARKRQLGTPVDEWSSLVPPDTLGGRLPVGPIVLIAIGILFLLDSLDVLQLRQVGRYWPVLLIVIGVWMLYARLNAPGPGEATRDREERMGVGRE
ncbi:MAG: hypothetical protein JOZ62_20440 [Acidobacteriaceae bacterium]|nr:hypothetical protein [Acidobacteriaceae bacterium]